MSNSHDIDRPIPMGPLRNYYAPPAPQGPSIDSQVGTPVPQPNLFKVNPGRYAYTKYDADGPGSHQVLSNVNGASVAGALANGGVMAPGYPGAPQQNSPYPVNIPRTDFTSLWALINQLAPGSNGQMQLGGAAGTPGMSLGGMNGNAVMS